VHEHFAAFRWKIEQPSTDPSLESDRVIESLRTALSWKPQKVPEDDGSRISRLENELAQLRKDRREAQSRIDAATQFARRASGYQNEATEQLDRLASIKALPKNPDTSEWQWPFCEQNLGLASPVGKVLLNELKSLNDELQIAIGQRPKLEAYLSELDNTVRDISGTIKEKESELSAAIAANEVIAEMSTRNNAAARVVGRISLFLENLAPD
jgi:chaperonin cofactor prefoldin